MNVEAHPNIQAVQFTMDIMYSLDRTIRGDALSKKDSILIDDKLATMIEEFVINVSTRVDEITEQT